VTVADIVTERDVLRPVGGGAFGDVHAQGQGFVGLQKAPQTAQAVAAAVAT
jgi:hypothetical protein